MCGRFVITSPPAALRQIFGYIEQPNFPPRHNIAPTQPIPVVMLENGGRHFRLMRWGLVPAWVKDARKLLRGPSVGEFDWHEVSTRVNRVVNDDEQLVLPITDEERAAEEPKPARKATRKVTPVASDDEGQGSLF